jgi:4-aminobutyrate aminotransferase/(S)-3-amino-2-methylpropionate transaminase
MLGMEFVQDAQTKAPAPEIVSQIINEARSRGLLLLKAGLYGNVIRVLVPLVASESDIDQALQALEGALVSVFE